MAQHCPECGFANDDGASYCQRCGAFLAHGEQPAGVSTATYKVGETGELEVVELEDVVRRGAALVIRAGGGRAGESFPLEGDRITVGRRPLAGADHALRRPCARAGSERALHPQRNPASA